MSFDQQALIRSIGVLPGKYMLLLGAGASATSGVPTANQCVWEWKREIFLSGNPGLTPSLFSDMTLPNNQARIQSWLDQQGCFPSLGDEAEYVHYIEKCYPRTEARSAYFNKRMAGVVPESGYQLLAMLHNRGAFQWIWTSNFDGLVRQSRKPEHASPIKEIALDSSTRILEIQEGDKCGYLVALHGDYRYDRLQNTTSETQALNNELCAALIARVAKQPLIVIGYGGRDESIMHALETAVCTNSKGGGIYWCVRPSDNISSRVRSLIETAKASGLEGDFVEISGFDDFMLRTARYIFRTGQEAAEVDKLISATIPARSDFRLSGYKADEDWIKGNALSIELPRSMYQFEARDIATWKKLREVVGIESIAAGLLKGKILAIGDATKISGIFGGRIESRLELVPLDQGELLRPNSVVVSILLEALHMTISLGAKLEKKGKRRRTLWDKSNFKSASSGGVRYKAFEAINICLTFVSGRQFLNLVPDLHVTKEDGSDADADARADIKRQLLGRQWNREYNDAVEDWCDRILGDQESRIYNFPEAPFDSFNFKISKPAPYARILVRSSFPGKPPIKKAGELFEATVLNEPQLVFGNARGSHRPKDPHPLRGVLNDGPYDLELTRSGLYREIRLGVICPRGYETALQKYLNNLLLAHSAIESKDEYLVQFPGFQQAYRIPLKIPNENDQEWRSVPAEHAGASSALMIQRNISGAITREIDNLVSLASIDLAIIFIPRSWKPYEAVENENVRLDLHDYVKAYCAQRAVRTQFLREDTLTKELQCEVLWWLAQAIYVKSLRTPFVLENNDSETVFVGIGYGMAKRTEGGVVLGCSHIYDAAGQGLRYQVSRIQNPVWIQDSPFLKKDDAINLGYQVKQLFHQTYQQLPRRVVIHKRTPFLRSEQEGLAQSLKGIAELEMITIEHEDAWRFLAYNKVKQSTDGFPVKRNSVMIYGNNQFLLWVHGAAKGIKDGRTYFQGKSRIPNPLKVTRFTGHAPVETIASEILGLSKMNWNTCDLYGQLPASLESSSAIARVGQLLARFGPETYDYRLFI